MVKGLRAFLTLAIGFSGSFLNAHQAQVLTIPAGVLTSAGIPAAFVAHFALFVSCVLLWTLFCGTFFKYCFRLPIIAGQIIGGILLGPSGINIGSYAIFNEPLELVDAATGHMYSLLSFDLFVFTLILIASTLTVSYLLWIAGHETDVRDLLKVGLTATTAGILGALIPIAMTVFGVFTLFSFGYTLVQAVGLGLIFAATSVSIPVAMLVSQKKMHLKSSKATLGAAIIDDVFAVILLSLFFIVVQQGTLGGENVLAGHQSGSLWTSLSYMFLAAVAIAITGYFLIPRFLIWLEKHGYSYLIASVASGMMLLYFAFAELFGGLTGITGAYFIGLFHKMGDAEHHAEKIISPYVNTYLLPLFLASIGLQLDMNALTLHEWLIVVLLLFIAILSKLLGCWVATGISNLIVRNKTSDRWTLLETYIFGSSMVARGEVGLVVSTILRGTGLITAPQYIIAVVVIVLTTIATPIMLAIGFAFQEEEPEGFIDSTLIQSQNIGLFEHIGAEQMFNIIVDVLGRSQTHETSVHLSEEGSRMITIDGFEVKIVLIPGEGITVEGNKKLIRRIMITVQKAIKEDIQALSQV
jgi:Kef-type K+ transport system membrane component KefB